ncbi:alpha/beta hydrolase [Streptomyces sp. NPDC088387]|uniref:alpha/beta hydrolase n=1 Tax=Streptomyces sp. NPDC088387 TaxID=3365859 RepID=UPI0037F39170
MPRALSMQHRGVEMESSTGTQRAVRTERVTFTSSGTNLVGKLFLPPTAKTSGRLPALVVTGAWGTVKEQMSAGYAREMAARGYIALTFDFRSWGESDGRPRSMEDPFAKAEDIVAAAQYLGTRPDVDARAIGGLGICASSAYMATAATRTDLISSLALVAPALPSRSTVAEHTGGGEGVAALRKAAGEAEDEYRRSGKEALGPVVEQTPENSVPGADYYTNPDRGMIPEWDNTFNAMSWGKWLEYDAQASADHLTQPLLLVHSDAAASPESVREFATKVPREVEQLWLDGVTQFDFYDRPGPMKTASDAAARHFAGTMKGA